MEFNRKLRRGALATGLALLPLAAAAQPGPAADAALDCRQLRAELAALAAPEPATRPVPDAAAAAGVQILGALAQQAGGRSGGLGGMFGGLMGGAAPAPVAQQGGAGQVLQLLQVAQAVQAAQGAPGGSAGDAAQAQAAVSAVAQVATLQALAQQRGMAGVGRNQADTAGVVGMLGGLLNAAQAAQPVAAPGHAVIQHLAGSRQEQLGGLYLAKGCQ